MREGNIKTDAENMVMNDLRAHFRPEFLNRLDEIIMFKLLRRVILAELLNYFLLMLIKRLEDKELELVDRCREELCN